MMGATLRQVSVVMSIPPVCPSDRQSAMARVTVDTADRCRLLHSTEQLPLQPLQQPAGGDKGEVLKVKGETRGAESEEEEDEERIFSPWQAPLCDWLRPLSDWQKPLSDWQAPLQSWYLPHHTTDSGAGPEDIIQY